MIWLKSCFFRSWRSFKSIKWKFGSKSHNIALVISKTSAVYPQKLNSFKVYIQISTMPTRKSIYFYLISHWPLTTAKFYQFKVSNRNTIKRCEIGSKLTIKTEYFWSILTALCDFAHIVIWAQTLQNFLTIVCLTILRHVH